MRFEIITVEYGDAEKQLLYLVKQRAQSGISCLILCHRKLPVIEPEIVMTRRRVAC